MAESSKVEKEDNLEESLSSEEWTIIYKKESKTDVSEEKTENEVSNKCIEDISTEDDTYGLEQNFKHKIEHVEIGEEAGEKEIESDDISIISDESESEQLPYEDRIERIDWQVEKQPSQSQVPSNSSSDGSITSGALITCSALALILGIIIAGQIVEFRGDEPIYSVNNEIQEKLRELIGMKEKLNELNDVKHALDQLQINLPEMKKLKDQLKYQKYEKQKLKYSFEEMQNFEKLNPENFLHLNSNDNRLEILESTYQNFCLTTVKIKSANSVINNELCKTPKILSDMIILKRNLKQAFEKTQETISPERRILVDVERKLDFVSESLLFEIKTVFSKFSMKIQERFNKLGYEMHNRLCFLYSSGKINDQFLNILLDKNYFLNNCNDSNSDPVIINLSTNATWKNVKNHNFKRKSYEEFKKNNYKFDYKNNKDYKKSSSKENSYKKVYNDENVDTKIKGEVKIDNWKINKNENKEKYSHEYKKQNKHEKTDNYKNDYKKNYDNDKKCEDNKIESHIDHKFENVKVEHDYKKKYENKKNFDNNYEAKRKKDNDFEHKFENKRIYEYEYNVDDSKFIRNLENYSDKFINNEKENQRHKHDKEYVLKLDNFKDSKYVKYQSNERRDKREKYRSNGDWQMQRGKAREKLRNSDWYFVRADLRQKARIIEDDEEETWNSRQSRKNSQEKSEFYSQKK